MKTLMKSFGITLICMGAWALCLWLNKLDPVVGAIGSWTVWTLASLAITYSLFKHER